MGDFARCMTAVRKEEGGNDDDPHDVRTSRGIIQPEYDHWCDKHARPRGDVWHASEADITAIYRANYWDRLHGDELPAGLDICLFDSAVNSGVGQTALWVQRTLCIKADGDFGPITFAAIAACRDRPAFIREVLSRRLAMDKALPKWKYFGKDWGARIARMLDTSLAWAADQHAEHPDVEFSTPRARPSDLVKPALPPEALHSITILGTIGACVTAGLQHLEAWTGVADLGPLAKLYLAVSAIGAVGSFAVAAWHRRYQALVDGSAKG